MHGWTPLAPPTQTITNKPWKHFLLVLYDVGYPRDVRLMVHLAAVRLTAVLVTLPAAVASFGVCTCASGARSDELHCHLVDGTYSPLFPRGLHRHHPAGRDGHDAAAAAAADKRHRHDDTSHDHGVTTYSQTRTRAPWQRRLGNTNSVLTFLYY